MQEAWHRLKYGISASVWALQDPRCHGCGCWMPRDQAHEPTSLHWCPECQGKFGLHIKSSDDSENKIHAACTLTPRLKHLMYRWKFHPRHPGALVLASLLCQGLSKQIASRSDDARRQILLIPIPPRKKPGVVHTVLDDRLVRLSGQTAALLGVRWLPEGLHYQRTTETQHFQASRAERFANMKQAFAPSPRLLDLMKMQPLTLIVLDDLTTSGATLLAAREALSVSGAYQVLPFAVAQVPLEKSTRVADAKQASETCQTV